jgi:hypothetical protein
MSARFTRSDRGWLVALANEPWRALQTARAFAMTSETVKLVTACAAYWKPDCRGVTSPRVELARCGDECYEMPYCVMRDTVPVMTD